MRPIGLLVVCFAACSSERISPQEARSVCPLFALMAARCEDEFRREFKEVDRFEGAVDDPLQICRGFAVGLGTDHPRWLPRLTACLDKPDCAEFAACAAPALVSTD